MKVFFIFGLCLSVVGALPHQDRKSGIRNLFGCTNGSNCKIGLKTHHNKYVVAEDNGKANANGNKLDVFSVTFIDEDKVQFKGHNGKYLVAELDGTVNADRDQASIWETWTVENKGIGKEGIGLAFKSFLGKYLVAEPNGELKANRNVAAEWETFRVVHENGSGGGGSGAHTGPRPSNWTPRHQDKQSVCPEGFVLLPGDIPGSGQIYNIPTTISDCSDRCNREPNCCSFEYSATEKKCNLNRDCHPTLDVYKDYSFCSKGLPSGFGCPHASKCKVGLYTHFSKYVVAKDNGEANANTKGNKIGKPEIFSVTFIGKDKVQFKGNFGKYLVAELNGRVNANRGVPGAWETWTVEKKGKWKFAFKSIHGKYLVAEPNGELNANRNVAGPWETFRIVNMCPDWLGLGICK